MQLNVVRLSTQNQADRQPFCAISGQGHGFGSGCTELPGDSLAFDSFTLKVAKIVNMRISSFICSLIFFNKLHNL